MKTAIKNPLSELEKVRILLETGKQFDAGGELARFIQEADTSEIQSAAAQIKIWLKQDLRVVYTSVATVPFMNESLWVLEQAGIADKLREAGILAEVAEFLQEAAIGDGKTSDVSRIQKFTGKKLTAEQIKKQLLVHANSCQYSFGRVEAEQLKELPIRDQKEIILAAIKRAVSLGWWDIITDLKNISCTERSGIENNIVDYILKTHFLELFLEK